MDKELSLNELIIWIKKGIEIYKTNFSLIFVCGLIAILISICSFGILSFTVFAAFALIILRLINNQLPKPEIKDIVGFGQFIIPCTMFWLVFIILYFIGRSAFSYIWLIGGILSFIYAICLTTSFMFTPIIIAQTNQTIWASMLESVDIVRPKFASFLCLTILLSMLNAVGALLFLIGLIITIPLSFVILCVAYNEIRKA